jgi:serine/threonine protein kinase
MKKPLLFGKYLLLERINVGGMAEVFIAKAFGVEGFERILAIKKILPTMAEDEEFITMFIDEARISVQLNHANIVHIHELGKHDETFYIAMEYVAGKDLRAILERYRKRKEIMPTAQAVFVASKICEGLDYAHRRKDARGNELSIIHRDVSPQNILLSYEGEVKIIDFGIAKAANRSQKTQAGILKGKFGYMSPEQVRGLPIDRRSDVFAVGVILYEMLTGEKLFVGESDFSTLEKVRNADVPLPRQFNPNIPAGLEKVVLKALAREQEDRYQWSSDLAEDLLRFLLAGDQIYSSKHLSGFLRDSFAEDLQREEEKMHRFATIERPDQIESSGVTATPSARPRRNGLSTPNAMGAPRASYPFIPPPTAAELAEMELAGDRTQIVDPETAAAAAASTAMPLDGKTTVQPTPMSMDDATANERPGNGATVTEAPMFQPVRRPSGSKVVIGSGSAYSGATVVGPLPSITSETPIEPQPPEPPGLNTALLPNFEEEDDASITAPRPSVEVLEEEERTGVEGPADSGLAPVDDEEYEVTPAGERLRPTRDKPRVTASVTAPGPGKVPFWSQLTAQQRLIAVVGSGSLVVVIVVVSLFLALSGNDKYQVVVFTDPEDARITIGGHQVRSGEPMAFPIGTYEVVATAAKYKTRKEKLRVVKGNSPPSLALKLDPVEQPKPPEVVATPPPSPAPPNPSAPGPAPDIAPAPPSPAPPPEKASAPVHIEPTPDTSPPEVHPPRPSPEPATVAAATPPPVKAPTFSARFICDELAVEVSVDGVPVGRTPNAAVSGLKLGPHRYVARKAGFRSKSGTFKSETDAEQLAVELDLEKERESAESEPAPAKAPHASSSGSSAPVPAKQPKAFGRLACSSKPAGAQVWVDGKYSGRDTPVALGNPLVLPVGKHEVIFKLKEAGKKSAVHKVEIKEDDTAKLVNVEVE